MGLQFLKDLPTKILGSEKIIINKDGTSRTEQVDPNIFQRIGSFATSLMPKKTVTPATPIITPTKVSPTLSPTKVVSPIQPQQAPIIAAPAPQAGGPDYAEIERKMRAGLKAYAKGSSVPVEQYIPKFIQAAKDYEFFRNNPYLLPQISILETSGGRNITRPNNMLNWGINYPGNNEAFSKMTPEQVMDIAISGLGKRSPYYNDIRKTNDLKKFATTYEPANGDYHRSLTEGIKFFEQQ